MPAHDTDARIAFCASRMEDEVGKALYEEYEERFAELNARCALPDDEQDEKDARDEIRELHQEIESLREGSLGRILFDLGEYRLALLVETEDDEWEELVEAGGQLCVAE
jgi:hypothetical protein